MSKLSKPLLGASASLLAAGSFAFLFKDSLTDLSLFKQLVQRFASGHKAKTSAQKTAKSKRNGRLFKQLFYILKRILPGFFCRETTQMGLLMLTLVARTFMSLFVARNMGQSVQHICNRNYLASFKSVGTFGIVTTFASVINAYLKYITAQLSINIRQRFLATVHEEYMKRNNYYRCTKLGDNKLQFADQLICDDISRWSESFAEVYSSIFKPVVDFFMFSWQMWGMMGIEGPLGMYLWFGIAAMITNLSLPPYGKLAARDQELEGEFRDAHCRLISNSEMIAFMKGETPELKILENSFHKIRSHKVASNKLKLSANIVMGYVNKYFASCVGFVMMIRPIYLGRFGLDKEDAGGIARYYVAIRHNMENMSNAVLALFEVQKKVGRLTGLTERVHELLFKLIESDQVFKDLKQLCPTPVPSNLPEQKYSDHFRFDKVSIYRPDGAMLAKDLSFEIEHGKRVIITGPNGCGKSSLFRILRGLWPLVEGKIEKPLDKDIYFLSQANFVPKGTLRHLITYPDEECQIRYQDPELEEFLAKAHLAGFEAQGVKPEMGTVLDWEVALSPGQKQRMGFARLFYHRPKFAVLDECTNGISPDVEEDLYLQCRRMGISVFSISHKIELKRLHDLELHYFHDAKGSYELIDLNE